MTIALDVGTRKFRSLKVSSGQLRAKTCPTALGFLPDKSSVRHLLETSGIRCCPVGGQLILWGESAEALAKDCAIKTEHLLARDPLRKQKQTIAFPLREVVASLLPHPSSGDICCLGMLSDELHADWLLEAVVSRGYQLVMCSQGLAAVLAELVEEEFTGLGLVFGGSKCEAVLAVEGEEIARCEVPRGGDAIDQSIAILEDRYWWSISGFRELETLGITEWKEALATSLLEVSNPRGERLLTGYRQLVSDLIADCESTFSHYELPDNLPVIVTGGSARIPGFRELLTEHLRESSLPMDCDNLRLATEEYTIARGLLIFAEFEHLKSSQSHAA
jgi:hypothetical protein